MAERPANLTDTTIMHAHHACPSCMWIGACMIGKRHQFLSILLFQVQPQAGGYTGHDFQLLGNIARKLQSSGCELLDVVKGHIGSLGNILERQAE